MSTGLEVERLIEEILEADIAEVSAVDHPATDRRFRFFKRADGAGKGVDGMRKQDELSAPPAGMEEVPPPVPEEEDLMVETVEIPASPETIGFSDIIAVAMERGLSEDDSIAVGQIIRKEYGNPDDPEVILVPEGSTIEGIVADAAIFGGIAVPQGLAGKAEGVKFTGKADEAKEGPHGVHWRKIFRAILRLDRKPGGEELLRREVRELMTDQSKNRQDLKDALALMAEQGRQTNQLLAAAIGVKLPVAPADSPPATPAAAAMAAVEAAGGTPTAAAPAGDPPAKRTRAERLKLLKELLAEEEGAESGEPANVEPVAPAPIGDPMEPDPLAPAETVPPGVMIPNWDGATPDLSGLPPEPATAPAKRILPASAKVLMPQETPAATGGAPKRMKSTLLGAYVSSADRKAAGWSRGID
jgi:hypothetical protein